MAKSRINQIYDLSALEAQQQKVIGYVDQLEKSLNGFKSVRLSFEGADNLKKLNTAQTELSVNVKEFEKIQTQLATAQAKLNVMESERAKKLAEIKLQQQELNKANKEAAKDALGLNDAYTKLSKEYEKAARTAQNLIVTRGKDNEETKKAIATAQKLGAQLKDTDAQVLKFQRNVGNYAESLSGGFELVRREITRLQREQKTLTIGGDTRGAEAANLRIKELDDIIKISFDDSKNFDQVVKSLQKSFSTMAVSGKQSNEFLNEFKQFAADAKDQSEDLRQEIKALSSDTRKLDLAAGSVSFLADSFQLAAGAAQLAGASEEDAAAATAKLVAVQSVANGLKGIANELTTKGTAANKAYAFVQGLVATSLDKSAAAGTRAKAALGLLGIAATVIGALVVAYAAFSKSASDAAIRQENFNEVLKSASGEYAKAIEQVSSLKNNVELAKKGFISKTEVVKQYNDSMGLVAGQAKNLNDVEQSLNKNAEAYIKFTFAKAVATAALAKAADLAVQAQLELLNPSNADERKAAESFSKTFGFDKDKVARAFEEDTKNKKTSLEKQIKDLTEFANQKQLEAAQLSKTSGFNFFGNNKVADNSNSTDAKEIAERNKKAVLEIAKIQLEAAAAIQKEIVSIESFSFDERIKALQNYIRLKTEIINKESDYEKTVKGLTADEIQLIEVKRMDDLQKLNDEATELFTNTAKEAVQATIDEMGDLPDEAKKLFDKMSFELEQGMLNLIGQLTDAQKKALDNLTKEFADKKGLQEIQDIYIDAFQTIASTTGSILDGIFDRQKNAIQEQIDDIDRLKQAEIDRVTAQQRNADGSIITEEQRAARIKIIEAKAQNDREKLELRQRQLDRQKAIAAKALNVFQLTIDGIQAVNKQRLILAEIRAKMAAAGPLGPALFGPSLALASAQLLSTIISSGAAITLAAAAPIPKFAAGKKPSDSYEGIGIAGEAGRELHFSKNGTVALYEKPTLTYVGRGDTILPNRVTEDVLAAISLTQLAELNGVKNTYKPEVTKEMFQKQTNILKSIDEKSRIVINVQRGFEASAEYDYHMKH